MLAETETLTIQLPVADVHRLRRVAEVAQRSVDDVVAEALQANLPPLLDDIPEVHHADLALLEAFSIDELRKEMRAVVDSQRRARHEVLLQMNAEGKLDPVEHQELEMLRQEADLLMLRKAYAAVLLKWRGEQVPTLGELKTA